MADNQPEHLRKGKNIGPFVFFLNAFLFKDGMIMCKLFHKNKKLNFFKIFFIK